MSTEPVPQRLSDADRDEAADQLREHYSEGRLSQSEMDERLSAALQARYASDLQPLFVDLPAPHPGVLDPAGRWTETEMTSYAPPGMAVAPRQVANSPAGLSPQMWSIARALVWPVAILGAIGTGFWFGWIAIAVVASIVLRQLGPNGRTPPPRDPRI